MVQWRNGQVRANIVCREFARVGLSRVPDAKVIAKIAKLIKPEVVEQVHQRIVAMAKQAGAVKGQRMRVDTTVVEANIHNPTDSSLLGDGARVLTRLMKKVEAAAGGLAAGVRDRMRTVRKKVVAIAISARRKGPEGEKQRQEHYRKLIKVTRLIIHQAGRVSKQVTELSKSKQAAVQSLLHQIATMTARTKQVIRQTKARIFGGNTTVPDKVVSMFEPHTEIIRKGRASKPNGLNRSRYRGQDGMEKWVGWGVIADNLITLGGLIPAAEVPA